MADKKLSPLISAENLAAMRSRPDVIVVDARGGSDAADRFEAGHLNGAIFLDLESDLSKKGPDAARGGRHPLPDLREFGVRLGRSGILPSTHILVYDDKAGANAAARFWWMMRAVGHESVQVIDGGLDAIRSAGLPVARGKSNPPRAGAPYPVTGGWKLPIADMDEVDCARSSSDAVVIDVREGYRYRGEAEPIDNIAGHIPGAVNLPYTDNLEQDGRFHQVEVLKRRYSILTEGKKAIVHCGSGVTACHALLAMAAAGIDDACLYVGSWSEWSRNPKPVATGAKP